MRQIRLQFLGLYILFLLTGNFFIHAQDSGKRQITIAWDTSHSMENNQPEFALRFLDSIFSSKQNFEVRFIAFTTDATLTNFSIQNGDWNELRNHIKQLNYDGAAVYSVLSALLNTQETYIYTDGKQVFSKERLPIEKGYTLLSRAIGLEQRFLERSALLYRGRYVQLEPYTQNQSSTPIVSNSNDILRGRIFIDNMPAEGLLVQQKDAGVGSYTDASGRFAIRAKPGDSLLISGGAFNMPILRGIPQDMEPNFFLDSRVIALDEVELIQRQRREAGVEAVDLGFGETDKNRVGVAVQSIGEDRISSVTTDVSKAIQGKFSGVQLDQESDISKVTMRTNNTMLLNNYGLIVIDGIPMQQGDSSGRNPQPAFNFVDPENIADITVLKGMAATTKYGTLGANGVILITTKNAVYGKGQTGTVDRARLRNNNYTGEDLTSDGISMIQKQLAAVPGDLAYSKYLELQSLNANKPEFYTEAFAFFKAKDPTRAGRILSNLVEGNPTNPYAYITVLQGLTELNLSESGMAVAASLAELLPNIATPILYQAATTQDTRELNELLRNLILLKNGLDKSTPLSAAYAEYLEKEIKHLVYNRRFEVNKSLLPEKYHIVPTYKARLVFEWNHPGAEFSIQSVNPSQKYYTWEHSNFAQQELLQEEIASGIMFKDFDLFGEGSSGQWLFNVEFMNSGPEGKEIPFLISCKLYENFGTPQETVKIITQEFSVPQTKKTMLQFSM